MIISAHKSNNPFILLIAFLLSVSFFFASDKFNYSCGYDPFPIGGGGGDSEMMMQAKLYREQFRADLYSTQAKLRASMEKARICGERERRSPYAPCYWGSPSSKATPKAGTVYTTMVPAVAHVRDSSDIVRTLRGAGASASDLSTIVNDPILKALRELRDRRPDSFEEQHPEVRDLHDLSREVHDYSSDLMRSLDAPAQRIIDDVLIPTLCVTALAVDILAPPLAPLTSPMLAVAAPRLMPVIGRALTAVGGAELYKRITTFFNVDSSTKQTTIDLPKFLGQPKMIRHHLFNKFWKANPKNQKYREFFNKHKINVDDYCIEIPATTHMRNIHNNTKDWTHRWKVWIEENQEATTKEVYQFAGRLMDEYGVSHVPIRKYR